MAKTLYLVWSPCKTECVGFFSKADAKYAATGKMTPLGCSTLADNFRDTFWEDSKFEVQEITIASSEDEK